MSWGKFPHCILLSFCCSFEMEELQGRCAKGAMRKEKQETGYQEDET